MKIRFVSLFVLFLAIVAIGSASATQNEQDSSSALICEAPTPIGVSVEAASVAAVVELAPDPYLELSEITTSPLAGGGFCVCAPGINCCGDQKRGCGLPSQRCFCGPTGSCLAR